MKTFIKKALRKWTGMSLMLRIFIGLVIGTILALTVPQLTGIAILGKVFVSALKAIAPVLVFILVMASIAKARTGLGPRFRSMILLYLSSSFIAALVAVVGCFLFPVTLTLGGETAMTETGEGPVGLSDVFTHLLSHMVDNPMSAVVNANYIGILFWSIIFGVALKWKAGENTIRVVDDFAEVVSLVVRWIIQFAPFGILGLVFGSVAEGGIEVFSTYGNLILVLVGCMLFNALVSNPLLAFLLLRRNPYPLLFTCLKESGLNAFFTRSSAANIPINMNLCKQLGLDPDFYSVSIPLGATINMDGAAVTITVMTMAVAHTLGMEVTFLSALLLCVVATFGACGASGVAGGSLLLIPMACSFFGISNDVAMQAVAIGFVIGVVQDSVETALNSSGDAFFTATAEYYDEKRRSRKSRPSA